MEEKSELDFLIKEENRLEKEYNEIKTRRKNLEAKQRIEELGFEFGKYYQFDNSNHFIIFKWTQNCRLDPDTECIYLVESISGYYTMRMSSVSIDYNSTINFFEGNHLFGDFKSHFTEISEQDYLDELGEIQKRLDNLKSR